MTSLPFSTSLFIYPEAYFDVLTDIIPLLSLLPFRCHPGSRVLSEELIVP